MSRSHARPKKKDNAKARAAQEPRGKPIGYELLGLGLLTLGVLLLLSVRMHGRVPDALLHALQWLFGILGAWGVAVALILLGVLFMMHLSKVEHGKTSWGTLLVFLAVISLLQLRQEFIWNPTNFAGEPGGLIGGLIALSMKTFIGDLAWVVLVAMGIAGIALMTDTPLLALVLCPFKAVFGLLRRGIGAGTASRRARREAQRAARIAAMQASEPGEIPHREPVRISVSPRFPDASGPVLVPPAPVVEPGEPLMPVTGAPSPAQPEQLQIPADVFEPTPRPYTVPPVDLLSFSPAARKQGTDDSSAKILALEETLRSFGIDAKVKEIERGPRVTRFEIVPPPGVRINRITNLADNIALSLAALDVRVEAPVPGKGVVGIEVPNRELVMVDLREVIESEPFQKSKSPLTFCLGRDISGHPRCADLARMPHLLIAGATNSGKSVCINSLICSILMRATPGQVKFLMVDPKRVELTMFQEIPHLIAPVAHDAKHTAGLLRWAIREMEQRYEMFAERCVRNITGFNEQSRLEGLAELPCIVIVIDELADLMMQAAAEFEASICRLAQLARATGIHLVVATQRPSVNVITGTIKANIPSRIAFAVASQVDSRTILDMNGAERLVGEGDMLYLPVEASKPARIQGAFVSEPDIARVVQFVKAQAKPYFTDEIMRIEEQAIRLQDGQEGPEEPEDELFAKALDYIHATKYASTSMLQRKFRIGYTRAARLMDQFEERGYVGPGQGSKPREVIFAPAVSVVGSSGGRMPPLSSRDDEEDGAAFRDQDEE